jgi:hypothetical protein
MRELGQDKNLAAEVRTMIYVYGPIISFERPG